MFCSYLQEYFHFLFSSVEYIQDLEIINDWNTIYSGYFGSRQGRGSGR
jgi:hypothetical protein